MELCRIQQADLANATPKPSPPKALLSQSSSSSSDTNNTMIGWDAGGLRMILLHADCLLQSSGNENENVACLFQHTVLSYFQLLTR